MYRPQCDAIIFDLDGTLWDASAVSANAWSKALRKLGVDIRPDADAIKRVSGLPFDQCVEILCGPQAKSIPGLKDLLDEAEHEEFAAAGGALYPGVLEGLENLRREYPLFLASNCQAWYLDAFYRHSGLKNLFTDAICFGQTRRPKQFNLAEIRQRNGIRKAIYFGDTAWDQEAAFYAGIKFIFAEYGFGAINISSPSAASFTDLVRLKTLPKGVPEVEIRKLTDDEFFLAQSFYQTVGYKQAVRPENKFFGAVDGGELVGLVRLALEENVWVLRGMQIKPSHQFFGIGTRLIKLLEHEIKSTTSFCLPHGWLEGFYGQIGFRKVEALSGVPAFLAKRIAENQKKYPHLILMKRSKLN